jgi:hypothetical protein
MNRYAALSFLSVFVAPALVHAEPGVAGAAQPVAPAPHAGGVERRAPRARPVPSDEVDPEMRQEWYGWQTLSADAASLLLAIGAIAGSQSSGEVASAMGVTSLGMYAFGAPITHFAHGNPVRGVGSFVMRGGLPFIFGAVGMGLEDCPSDADFCGLGGAVLGGFVGILTAIAADAALLSYEEVPVEESPLPNIGLAITREGAALVAGGTF